MNISRRLVIPIFLVLVFLFIGLVFWPFILNEILQPIALVIWLLLRIFVLSIDQKFYWGTLIFAMVFFLYRLLPQESASAYPEVVQGTNAALKDIDYWRNLFLLNGPNAQDNLILKRELMSLVIDHYATQQNAMTGFEIHDALYRKEIPIPEHIYTYLFASESQKNSRSLKAKLQTIGQTPRQWLHRLSGREAAEHKWMINEVLTFLETALEIEK